MTPERAYLHALRTDYMVFIGSCFHTLNPGAAFEDNWHLHAIAEQLRRIDAKDTKRLAINVPPRSGKSIMTTIGYSAWRHGRDPRERMICVSRDESLVRSLAGPTGRSSPANGSDAPSPQFRIRRGGDRATETITTLAATATVCPSAARSWDGEPT